MQQLHLQYILILCSQCLPIVMISQPRCKLGSSWLRHWQLDREADGEAGCLGGEETSRQAVSHEASIEMHRKPELKIVELWETGAVQGPERTILPFVLYSISLKCFRKCTEHEATGGTPPIASHSSFKLLCHCKLYQLFSLNCILGWCSKYICSNSRHN